MNPFWSISLVPVCFVLNLPIWFIILGGILLRIRSNGSISWIQEVVSGPSG